MAARFETPEWRALITDEFRFADLGMAADDSRLAFTQTKRSTGTMMADRSTRDFADAGYKCIGEINEQKMVLGGKKSAGLSIKDYYPAKNGFVTRLPAATAIAANSPAPE